MKKLPVLALSCLLTFTAAFAEVKEADQKWLTVVEKMVSEGNRTISTPNQDRVDLLKKWGEEKGYTVKVTKNDEGYTIELTAKAATKTVARSK